MFRPRSLLMVGFVAAILFAAVPASAGHTYSATGLAKAGENAYRVNLSGHLDQLGPPGSAIFSIQIFLPAPSSSDPSAITVFEQVSFNGSTNFLDATTQPTPFVVQADYWAEANDANLTFRIDGVRTLQTVTATGHYQGYELSIGASVVSL